MENKNSVFLIDVKSKLVETVDQDEVLNYVNILKYVKEVYDISVIHLSMIFNVNRQTIYLYINDKVEIPEKIKSEIAHIYGVESFRDVCLQEFKPNYYRAKIQLVYSNDSNTSLSNKDSIYIEGSKEDYKMKKEFDFTDKWVSAYQQAKDKREYENNDVNVRNMSEYMSNNSVEFNKRLVKLISKTKNDDEGLLDVIGNYLEMQTRVGNLGKSTSNIGEIQKHIDRVTSYKQLISLEKNDFTHFPSKHIGFSVKYMSEFEPIFPKVNQKFSNAILHVVSPSDIKLSEINIVLESLIEKYGNDLNILYGAATDKTEERTIIDVFIID